MTTQGTVGPVPAQVQVGSESLTIHRAWPRGRSDEAQVVLVEGRDALGRLRAGRLWLQPDSGLGWRVSRSHLAPAGRDPKLPELAAAAAQGDLLVHRYGRRAVVRRRQDVVKIVRPGEGASVATAARHGYDLARSAGFAAPRVRGVSTSSVSFSILPGRSLHELGGVLTTAEWSRWWDRWADRWTRLAQPWPAGRKEDAPAPHTAHDEVLVLRRWLDWVTGLEALPTILQHRVTERVAAVTSELISRPAQALVISHRDLHDKQMLAADSSLGLLDFDTVALAEPALDLANLAVHAHLRAAQGLWSARHSQIAQDAVDRVVATRGVDHRRMAAYAEATRLRLACLYAVRPPYRELALGWAAEETATARRPW